MTLADAPDIDEAVAACREWQQLVWRCAEQDLGVHGFAPFRGGVEIGATRDVHGRRRLILTAVFWMDGLAARARFPAHYANTHVSDPADDELRLVYCRSLPAALLTAEFDHDPVVEVVEGPDTLSADLAHLHAETLTFLETHN